MHRIVRPASHHREPQLRIHHTPQMYVACSAAPAAWPYAISARTAKIIRPGSEYVPFGIHSFAPRSSGCDVETHLRPWARVKRLPRIHGRIRVTRPGRLSRCTDAPMRRLQGHQGQITPATAEPELGQLAFNRSNQSPTFIIRTSRRSSNECIEQSTGRVIFRRHIEGRLLQKWSISSAELLQADMEETTLPLKAALSVTTMRPTVSAWWGFHTRSWGIAICE